MSLWDALGEAAIDIGADLIVANQTGKNNLDAVREGQQGSSASTGVSVGESNTTASETSTGSTESSSNTLSDLLSNSNLDEKSKSELSSLLTGQVTSGTAESDAALAEIFANLDPSKFGPEMAEKMGTEASNLAVQQSLTGSIGKVLGQGTSTGSFGSTAQAQLALAASESAARSGQAANLDAQALAGQLRGQEMDSLLSAISKAQAGNQTTTQEQAQTETGSKTQDTTTDQSTSTTDTSQTTTEQESTGESTTEQAQVDKNIGSTTDKSMDKWIQDQFN